MSRHEYDGKAIQMEPATPHKISANWERFQITMPGTGLAATR